MVLDTPAVTTQTWTGNTLTGDMDATVGADTSIGASFDFTGKAGQVIQAKVGISFISAEQAKQNVQQVRTFILLSEISGHPENS